MQHCAIDGEKKLLGNFELPCTEEGCTSKIFGTTMFQKNQCPETPVSISRGGFRGGGGGGGRALSGIPPPADPKGPPFDTFLEIHFWLTDPKIFLKAPLAPIYTNFEGERAPKKTRFFCQIFSKSAQKRLF